MVVNTVETPESDIGNLGSLLSSLNSGIVPSETTYRAGRQTRIKPLEDALVEIRTGLSEVHTQISDQDNESGMLTPEKYAKATAPLRPYADALHRASDVMRVFETGRIDGRKVTEPRWSKGKTKLPPHVLRLRELRGELYDAKRGFDARYGAWQSNNIGKKAELERTLHEATLSDEGQRETFLQIYKRLDRAYEALRSVFGNFSDNWLQNAARILGTQPEFSSVFDVLMRDEAKLQRMAGRYKREVSGVRKYVAGELERQERGLPYTLSKGNSNSLLEAITTVEAQIQEFERVFDGSQESIRIAMHTASKLDQVLAQASKYQLGLSQVQASLAQGNFSIPDALSPHLSADTRSRVARDLGALRNYRSAYDHYQQRLEAAFNFEAAAASVAEAYNVSCERLGERTRPYLTKTIEAQWELPVTRQAITNLLGNISLARQFKITHIVDKPNQVISDAEYRGLTDFVRILQDAERSLSERRDDSSLNRYYASFRTAMRDAELDQRYPSYLRIDVNRARQALDSINSILEQSVPPKNLDPRVANLFTVKQQSSLTIDPAQVSLLESYELQLATRDRGH